MSEDQAARTLYSVTIIPIDEQGRMVRIDTFDRFEAEVWLARMTRRLEEQHPRPGRAFHGFRVEWATSDQPVIRP